MKNFLKGIAIIALISAGVACEKKSTNSEPQAQAPSAELSQVPTAEPMTVADAGGFISPTGNAVTTSAVVAHESAVGEIPAGHDAMSWEDVIAMYPVLSDRISFLASIDKVVETDARTIDLYSAGTLVMTLAYNEAGDSLVVKNVSHANFSADLITFESLTAEQSQGTVVDSLDFMLSSCQVAEPAKQEQEQAQEGKEVAKEEPKQAQEQSQKEVAKEEPKQAQEQAQKEMPKEEPKEEPKQECASIVARLILQQVVEKQEQAQETKEQPKEEPKQEVVKEEPKQAQKQAQKEMPKEEPKQEAPKAPEQEQKAPVAQKQG